MTELEKKRRAKFARLALKYLKALFKGRTEKDIQKFLAENPELPMEAFNDGSVPLDLAAKFPLGTEYVRDFVVLEYVHTAFLTIAFLSNLNRQSKIPSQNQESFLPN